MFADFLSSHFSVTLKRYFNRYRKTLSSLVDIISAWRFSSQMSTYSPITVYSAIMVIYVYFAGSFSLPGVLPELDKLQFSSSSRMGYAISPSSIGQKRI